MITMPAFPGRMSLCLPHHHAFPQPHVNSSHDEMLGFVEWMQPPSLPSSLPSRKQQASWCSAGTLAGAKLGTVQCSAVQYGSRWSPDSRESHCRDRAPALLPSHGNVSEISVHSCQSLIPTSQSRVSVLLVSEG